MKKGWTLIGVLLAMLAATPSLAQTTGVAVDGRVYTFTGDAKTYTVDGMTFVIGEEEVTVIYADGREVCLPLEQAAEDCVAVSASIPGSGVTSVIYEEDLQIGSVCEELNAVSIAVDDVAMSLQPGVMAAYSAQTDIATIAEDTGLVYGKATSWSAEEEFALYEKYGLHYDVQSNVLSYQGKRVRVMEDEWSIDASLSSAIRWFDETGEVDVRVIRDDTGALTGLQALSDAQFAARDLSAWLEPNVTRMEMTATSERALTPEELATFFEPYSAFGLRYDAARDLLFYGEKQVRRLVDVRKSNGEEPGSGRFSGELTQLVYEGGEADVTAVRDYEHPNAEGEGTLMGLNVTAAK